MTRVARDRRDGRAAGLRFFVIWGERRAQRPVVEFGGAAGCDGFGLPGNSVLPDGLIVVFIPPFAPLAPVNPPVPVPVVVPVEPGDTPLDVPTPGEAPVDAPPPVEPPALCAKAAVDEIASAKPKVIAASFMKSLLLIAS
ncbi:MULTISPECIES: hypothetical protein [Bradyrhizobium]|uniref:hypothetical protein n=1 Tax=Bradyrhizobium TaxID=374 RepID=UPI0012ECB5DF|nr:MULTISPECIES: hypothetical protein [Bradyrhizobium]